MLSRDNGKNKSAGKANARKPKLLPSLQKPGVTVRCDGMQPIHIAAESTEIGVPVATAIEAIELAAGKSTVTITHPERWSPAFRAAIMPLLVSADGKARFAASGKVFDSSTQAVVSCVAAARNPNHQAKVYEVAVELVANLHPQAPMESAAELHSQLKKLGYRGRSLPQMKHDLTTLGRPIAAKEKAIDVARGYLASLAFDHEVSSTIPPLLYHRQRYYVYRDETWRRLAEEEVRCAVTSWMQAQEVSANSVRDVMANLQGLCCGVPWELDLPIDICADNFAKSRPSSTVLFANGAANVESAIQRQGELELLELTPHYFSTTKLPFDFNAGAQCPLWLDTLADIFPQSGEGDMRIPVLQEYFGYSLIRWPFALHKALILVGGGSNGKSTVLEILEAMIGKLNVSYVGLDRFGNRFDIATMHHKLLNVMRDMPRMSKAAEDVLKLLISNEPVQAEEKFLSPFEFRYGGKLVFATNHLPRFSDPTDGFWRRWLIMPFLVSFQGRAEDKNRVRRLMEELPGISNWALTGARRLYQQQEFSACSICQNALDSHRQDQDVVAQFVAQCCVLAPEHEILCTTLYERYRDWSWRNGRQPYASTGFGAHILDITGVTKKRPGTAGERPRYYAGIDLR